MNRMKRGVPALPSLKALALWGLVILAVVGCGGSPRQDEAVPVASGGDTVQDPNACHLLSHEQVSALVEETIVMRDQTDAGETWSTCEWQDENGLSLFMLTVYWAKGRQEWETWRIAQGLGDEALKQAEGVSADDVVHQGPVAGIGDAAYFSTLLPSLVLQGDVLLEINLFFVPNAEAKFAPLARQLLAAIR
ncbi:MAG: hypothetical protein ACUVWZ_03660 [Anaerolineae bacterium]